MEFIIRDATVKDAEGKGYVHYQAWNEAYTGLIDQAYLNSRTIERCVRVAKEHPQNTVVAVINERVVGFASYLKSRDEDLPQAGEVMALYVLEDYYGLGIGKRLMEESYFKLSDYKTIIIWVLKTNVRAIGFYKKLGFEADSKEKIHTLSNGASIDEIRMIKKIN